jgi:hypothetical protein
MVETCDVKLFVVDIITCSVEICLLGITICDVEHVIECCYVEQIWVKTSFKI